jgi:hypothetical protein
VSKSCFEKGERRFNSSFGCGYAALGEMPALTIVGFAAPRKELRFSSWIASLLRPEVHHQNLL